MSIKVVVYWGERYPDYELQPVVGDELSKQIVELSDDIVTDFMAAKEVYEAAEERLEDALRAVAGTEEEPGRSWSWAWAPWRR